MQVPLNQLLKSYSFNRIIGGDLDTLTKLNENYRHVIATSETMQLVLMSLKPYEEIGLEVHENVTQFIKVEQGNGRAIVGEREFNIKEGSMVFVYPGLYHNIINTSNESLKLYTLYAPPNHRHGLIQENKPTQD